MNNRVQDGSRLKNQETFSSFRSKICTCTIHDCTYTNAEIKEFKTYITIKVREIAYQIFDLECISFQLLIIYYFDISVSYMRVLLFMMGKINFKTMENSTDDNSVQKDANSKEIVTPRKK